MQRWVGKVALVTGASAGIGADIAKRLTGHGMKVVGCARNLDALEKLREDCKKEPGSLTPIKCDMTNEQDILDMFKKIKSDLGGVDVCVNNAGLGHLAPLLSGETKLWKDMLDVNVLGLAVCARESFQSMHERKVDGHIILMNSYLGHRVQQLNIFHFYTATKFAVTAILEGIRTELREINSPVRVTSISPGFVDTEFFKRLHRCEATPKLYSENPIMPSSAVTDSVIHALSAPANVEIHDILLRPTQQIT